jgi:hypothetical protein
MRFLDAPGMPEEAESRNHVSLPTRP